MIGLTISKFRNIGSGSIDIFIAKVNVSNDANREISTEIIFMCTWTARRDGIDITGF